jgi:hypothetical protein
MVGEKMIRCVYVLLFLTMFYAGSSAQINYQMSLDNGQIVDFNTFEFNVFIKSIDSTFQLTSYQCSFTFYVDDADGKSLSFSYISGTSELSNPPSLGIRINDADGTQKLTFASMPGSDYITSEASLVGRFRLQNTASFKEIYPTINWNFEGKITTILTGNNFVDITNPSNHTKNFGNLVKYNVIGVTATGTPAPNNTPGKTIDGLGYNDGDPDSRWAAQPMPQNITFDLGSEVPVSMTKFSFYNFQEGRIYQYTIALSNDQVNWNEAVVNASSASKEWTTNQFVPQKARYVRLIFISSTNNPNNWANLWEAQIWGESQTSSIGSSDNSKSLENFRLSQNYPNPFNPSTNIELELKEDANVKLAVYNVLGEEVAELFNGEIQAGTHKFEFNAAGLASGVYVYRLDAREEFTETKKMVLMR